MAKRKQAQPMQGLQDAGPQAAPQGGQFSPQDDPLGLGLQARSRAGQQQYMTDHPGDMQAAAASTMGIGDPSGMQAMLQAITEASKSGGPGFSMRKQDSAGLPQSAPPYGSPGTPQVSMPQVQMPGVQNPAAMQGLQQAGTTPDQINRYRRMATSGGPTPSQINTNVTNAFPGVG